MRQGAQQRMLAALNFTSSEHVLDLPKAMPGSIRVSPHADRDGETVAGHLRLRADEGCVLEVGA